MGTANSIEARLLQELDPAFFGCLIRACTENAVIMVDASAPKQGFPAVKEEPLGTPCYAAKAEVGLCAVLNSLAIKKLCHAAIELRLLHTPKSGFFNCDRQFRALIANLRRFRGDSLFSVVNCNPNGISALALYLDMGAVALRVDQKPVGEDMRF